MEPYIAVLALGRCRQSEIKNGAFAQLRLHPNFAAVQVDNFFAHRESDAGAGVILAVLQALKDEEDSVGVFSINANAVVLHREQPLVSLGLAADVNLRRSGTAEF